LNACRIEFTPPVETAMPRNSQYRRSAPPTPRRVLLALVLALAPLSGCTNPAALAELHNQLEQAADAVNDIRMNLATLQSTIDSLTVVAAKQDSIIVKLAVATNVQIIK
jgi:outer membrane murein-binding lipoprotein Lpp